MAGHGVIYISNPAPEFFVVINPPILFVTHSDIFIQRLTAPPVAPHVSGIVMQASLWVPKSIHSLFVQLKDKAEPNWSRGNYDRLADQEAENVFFFR